MVSFSIFSLSLTLAHLNLHAASCTFCVSARPDRTIATLVCPPAGPSTTRLCTVYSHMHSIRTDRLLLKLEDPLEEDKVKGLREQNEVSKHCTAFHICVVEQLLFVHRYHRSQRDD